VKIVTLVKIFVICRHFKGTKTMSEQGKTTEDAKLPTYSTPRWVKAFGIAAIVLLLLIAILMLTGEHGLGRHFPSAEATITMEHGG
jgi:hypothetical protein